MPFAILFVYFTTCPVNRVLLHAGVTEPCRLAAAPPGNGPSGAMGAPRRNRRRPVAAVPSGGRDAVHHRRRAGAIGKGLQLVDDVRSMLPIEGRCPPTHSPHHAHHRHPAHAVHTTHARCVTRTQCMASRAGGYAAAHRSKPKQLATLRHQRKWTRRIATACLLGEEDRSIPEVCIRQRRRNGRHHRRRAAAVLEGQQLAI